LKGAIQSTNEGSVPVIPREGCAMVRFYVEIGTLHPNERAAVRSVDATTLIRPVARVLAPCRLDQREVVWYSAHDVGQRVCDSFDDYGPAPPGDPIPRIFIAGEVCHTHSPRAGQGMNVSMADIFNLDWKRTAVLRGQARPRLLQCTRLRTSGQGTGVDWPSPGYGPAFRHRHQGQ
jgi:phenol 2-monooxygenase